MQRSIVGLVLLLACGTSELASAAIRRAFVTSVSGNGRLGNWPDAGSATGLAAGDAICQARAAAAGLPGVAAFRAWLSDDTDDAYCRIHDLTGKVEDDCGQATLPSGAGPWRRSDDLPFAAAAPDLLNPTMAVYLPIRRDEFGDTVHQEHWTGTHGEGGAMATTCNNWVSANSAVDGYVGRSDYTGIFWSSLQARACDETKRLVCMQQGPGDALPPFEEWGRLAFLSSAQGTADLSSWPEAGGQSGLAAGDAICRNLAAAGQLPQADSFKAWLSTGSVDAIDRFAHDGPWMRLDGAGIADNLAGLTDGFIRAPINLTENGAYVWNNVWTGTTEEGVAALFRCSDWTDDSPAITGHAGLSIAGTGFWTDEVDDDCDISYNHLYCLQDLPLLFGNGFESGTVGVWSSTAP